MYHAQHFPSAVIFSHNDFPSLNTYTSPLPPQTSPQRENVDPKFQDVAIELANIKWLFIEYIKQQEAANRVSPSDTVGDLFERYISEGGIVEINGTLFGLKQKTRDMSNRMISYVHLCYPRDECKYAMQDITNYCATSEYNTDKANDNTWAGLFK